MTLDGIVAWYQKKIGTYDKQQWEKTVEQKILDGFGGVTLKTARLKTEFIDVDLVRGSTFQKAKPKQSLVTVIRLAILRYFLLPIYAKWWVRQTSPNVFAVLLFLYVTQMVSIALYTFNIERLEQTENVVENHINDTETASQVVDQQIVSLTQLIIPMALSLLLSLIHSQIVATNTASGSKVKRRRVSNNTGKQSKQHAQTRVRRRKKLVDFNRIRNQQYAEAAAQRRNRQSGAEDLTKIATVESCSDINEVFKSCCASYATTPSANTALNLPLHQQHSPATKLTLDLNTNATTSADCLSNPDPNNVNCIQKKRNVNWHSPIHNYASLTPEQPQEITAQLTGGVNNITNLPKTNNSTNDGNSSSSSSTLASPNKPFQIEASVQEFYNDLITRTDSPPPQPPLQPNNNQNNNANISTPRRNIGEDDGFESLNGKSSSGEDTMHSPAANNVAINQVRLRLNAGLKDESKMQPNAVYRRKMPPLSSEADNTRSVDKNNCDVFSQVKQKNMPSTNASSEDTDADNDDDAETGVSSPPSFGNNSNNNECTTSATEWLGITTNSEECSYSSELDNTDDYKNNPHSDEESNDLDFTPTTILNAHGTIDRISCTIWDQREIKKAQMSVLEISSSIIERVESMPETNDYIYIGVCFSFVLSLIPTFCRLCEITLDADKTNEISYLDMPMLLWEKAAFSLPTIFRFAFGHYPWERTILIIGLIQRICLTLILFIIFAVAERTFKQRFLYAKLFSHLTSSRRARKSNLPHFRLNKVRNIKTWLSVRSYLKKRGPQRSVDIIVSAAFIVTLLLLAFLSVEWLKDSVHLHSHLNLEALMWSTMIGIFLLRFMTLGNKIHAKYRSISVLITEQINLYLQIEQKPKKKDELMVSNSVLKLAADLLKELESPFKISGLSANPYLFTTIKVVILSALSGVLSEILGFKLKLHKIKIK